VAAHNPSANPNHKASDSKSSQGHPRWECETAHRLGRLLGAAVGVEDVVVVGGRKLVHRVRDHIVDADHVPHVLQPQARVGPCSKIQKLFIEYKWACAVSCPESCCGS
jgi:hypothetical protein